MQKLSIFFQLTLPLFIGLMCLFTACSYSGELITRTGTTHEGNKQFSISLPDYIVPEKDGQLSKTTSFQYCNYFRNIYLTIDDTLLQQTDTTKHLATYIRAKTNDLVSRLQKPQRVDSLVIQLNKHKAVQVSVTGDVGAGELVERMYYQLIFVQTSTHIYQLNFFMWDKWRDKYTTDLARIIPTFQEL